MHRRHFNTVLALMPGIALDRAMGNTRGRYADPDPWRSIEQQSQGRLGVAVLDTATGRIDGHRLDERFPMCSTFKWLLASAVLQRVAEGRDGWIAASSTDRKRSWNTHRPRANMSAATA